MLKKYIIFLSGLVCCLGLIACGPEKEEPRATDTPQISTEQESTEQPSSEKITIEISTEERETVITTEEESAKDEELLSILQQSMDARTYSGDCSIYVMDLMTGKSSEIDNHQRQAARLIK